METTKSTLSRDAEELFAMCEANRDAIAALTDALARTKADGARTAAARYAVALRYERRALASNQRAFAQEFLFAPVAS